MEINWNLNLGVETEIIIKKESGEVLCKTHNTITNLGKQAIFSLFSTTASINKIAFSFLDNVGLPVDATMFSDAIFKDITNSYSSINGGGELIMTFECNVKTLPAGMLKRIGLSIGTSTLFTVVNTGDIMVGDTAIIITYQMKFNITQGV